MYVYMYTYIYIYICIEVYTYKRGRIKQQRNVTSENVNGSY